MQNEELALIGDSVRTLFDRAGSLSRTREYRGASPGFDREIWQQMAAAGMLAGAQPFAEDSSYVGLSAMGVIAEEVGRALAPEPFISAAGLSGALLRRLPGDAARELGGRLTQGDVLVQVAWQEGPKSFVSNTPSTAFADGRLSGIKECVPLADDMDNFLVSATGSAGMAICRVEAGTDGVTVEARPQSDGSTLCRVSFTGVEIGPTDVLASGEEAGAALAAALDVAVVLTAAELVGVMSAAFEMTLDYLSTREQFGKPIGAFQALQHRAVDMKIQLEIAQAAVRSILGELDAKAGEAPIQLLSSRAKARAGDAALQICRECIQLHGAIGYTDDCDIGLYLNRALTLAAWLGNPVYHRRRYARMRGRA